MWIDQRDRDSKSGWVWGSIAFHAAIIALFIMSPSQNSTETVAPPKGSEAVTMTLTESKSSDEAATIAVDETADEVEKPIKKLVVAAKVKAKSKKAKKKTTPVVATLPKKEVVKEAPAEETLPAQAVVIPETTDTVETAEETSLAENEIQPIPLENLKEQSLDDEVARMQENPEVANAIPGKPEGLTNSKGSTGTESGSANNPRSYLDLKQKPGNIPPQYPESARLLGEQGRAKLRYFVDESGLVSNVDVVESSGSAALDKAAVNAISKYQYEPGQSGWASHPVNFTLKGPEQQTPGRLRTAGHP